MLHSPTPTGDVDFQIVVIVMNMVNIPTKVMLISRFESGEQFLFWCI